MKKQIPITWQSKTYILLFSGFVLFTVIGTLTHECGHYLVARSLGFSGGSIHFGYTVPGQNERYTMIQKIRKQYRIEIKNNANFPDKQQFEGERAIEEQEWFYIEAGGPLETILTGTMGLLLLIIFKKKFLNSTQLNLWQWLIIFTTLFWLRGLFNFVGRFLFFLKTGNEPIGNDEFNLSTHLGLGTWTISILSGIAGIVVLAFVTFKIIPSCQRFTFICAGLSGGIIGFVLWLVFLGPRLMP